MRSLISDPLDTISLSQREARTARDSGHALAEFIRADDQQLTLQLEDKETGQKLEAVIPAAAIRLLASALATLADGHTVTLLPSDADLSTQQAAELIGVSRPYFVKLLESGQLPFRKVGSQRRVRVDALRRYLARCEEKGVTALEEMTAQAQQMGLYE